MIRVLLWALLIAVVWRMIRRSGSPPRPQPPNPPAPRKGRFPFNDVEEAEFEDLSSGNSRPGPRAEEPH